MNDDVLFFKHDLDALIEHQRKTMLAELDGMSDQQLLNVPTGELEAYCTEKYSIDLPVLGEPQVDQCRTKMTVGRYGDSYGYGSGESVQVDAEKFTLEVPYTGDEILFLARGRTWNNAPPRGSVNSRLISTSIELRTPDADKVNRAFDEFLKDVNQWLGFLKPQIDQWNSSVVAVLGAFVDNRKQRAARAQSVASGLKFVLKGRTDAAATYTAPVAQKKIAPVLPRPSQGVTPEPVLTDAAYRDILDTLQQMSEVMERSPHAFTEMDEETLRFQFLVPLNARFEGEARGEVFNYGGKTDILITHNGRNIFVAELKIWSGPAALTEAVNQLLGYLSWRDTKTALVIFNRNKNFSGVLAQIDPTIRAHPNFAAAGPIRGSTEFQYTMHHRSDPARRLAMTVLAFDLPTD